MCTASSLVGLKIKELIPIGSTDKFYNIGNRYTIVLPVPVIELTIMFLDCNVLGKANCYI